MASPPSAHPSPRRGTTSRVALAGGSAMVALGLSADACGCSAEPGLGGLQLGLCGLGLAVAVWGASEPRPRLRRGLSRVYLMVGSVYLALWLLELLLAYPLNPRRSWRPHVLSLQGMYERGQRVSFRHVPGFTGTFDDGIVQVPLRINSRGDRDDEPRDDHPRARRLILIGDSFTFGQGLFDEQTIDHRIEQRSGGEVDAYNLGVMGYGPDNTRLRLMESSWWEGRAVYYLFFVNDLEEANSRPDFYTVHDGYVVPRAHPSGEAYTPQQWTELLAKVTEQNLRGKNRLSLTFTLSRLRRSVRQAMSRNVRLSGIPAARIPPDHITSAVATTTKMRAHAQERGASLTVVILPAVGEAIAGEYSGWTQDYVEGIRAQGIEVLEVLEHLDGEDYFVHDPHFDADGAQVVADAILDHFMRSAPP